MIKQLKFASIPTRDQDAAVKFWTQRCGFEIVTDQPMGPEMGNTRWIELCIRNSATRIVLFTPPGQEDRVGSLSGLSFECDDVKGTYEELVQRGVAFTQSPQQESWGTSAVFTDLDGNQFVLSSG
jgi:catechol 2,3-dioxygenase-like lactoylglutathione lyase family enzyme